MSEKLEPIRQTHRIGAATAERIVPWNACPGMASRGLWFAGISDAAPDYAMARPNPDRAHLLACFAGKGEVLVQGRFVPCTPGHAYLAPARSPMAFHTAGGKPDRRGRGGTEKGGRWGFAWVYLNSPPNEPPAIPIAEPVLVEADPRPLVNAIDGLYIEASHAARPRHLEAWAELVSLTCEDILRAGDPTGSGGAGEGGLWRLWADVDAAPAEPWTVARLAARVNMGPEALRRLCLAQLGRSPMRHVTHLRMRRAEAMLRSTPNKLYTIARAVGYENVFAFSTAFRRWKGVPPNACRSGAASGLGLGSASGAGGGRGL